MDGICVPGYCPDWSIKLSCIEYCKCSVTRTYIYCKALMTTTTTTTTTGTTRDRSGTGPERIQRDPKLDRQKSRSSFGAVPDRFEIGPV